MNIKIITGLGNSVKNNVQIDLVTKEDSDEVKYQGDTGIVYDGGRQLLGSSLEVKSKIVICQKYQSIVLYSVYGKLVSKTK